MYDATQLQRSQEADIRDTRRELIGLGELKNSPQAKADFEKYSVKLKAQEASYKDFCRQTGLIEQSERLRVYEFNKSLSQKAVWANKKALHKDKISVKLPTGEYVPLTEGTKITHKEVIAGKGKKRQIDVIDILLDKYKDTIEEEWQKKKGIGYVDYLGESYKTEIHWYSEPSVGDVEHKISTRGGNWFIDE